MGIFSQDKTTTNQTSINQQQGISTRDVTGAQLTSGGGSVSSFGTAGLSVGGGGSSAIYTQGGGISVGGGGSSGNVITLNQSLDATALDTAASLINNALTSNTQTTQAALSGFQNALSVQSEHAPPSGGGVSLAPLDNGVAPVASAGFSLNTKDIILLVAALGVVGLILYGRRK